MFKLLTLLQNVAQDPIGTVWVKDHTKSGYEGQIRFECFTQAREWKNKQSRTSRVGRRVGDGALATTTAAATATSAPTTLAPFGRYFGVVVGSRRVVVADDE